METIETVLALPHIQLKVDERVPGHVLDIRARWELVVALLVSGVVVAQDV